MINWLLNRIRAPEGTMKAIFNTPMPDDIKEVKSVITGKVYDREGRTWKIPRGFTAIIDNQDSMMSQQFSSMYSQVYADGEGELYELMQNPTDLFPLKFKERKQEDEPKKEEADKDRLLLI